jgi:hypothetical protein
MLRISPGSLHSSSLLLLLLLLLQGHRGEGGDAMDVDGEEAELLVSGTRPAQQR